MRETAKTFKELIVWQKSHELVLEIYKLTSQIPQNEMYGLTSQIRRSAVSIAANIAEGFGKRSVADKCRYFNISQGSLEETRYYLLLIEDLNYASSASISEKIEQVSKLLSSYIKAIQNSKT
jgi:four helix bundle protein